MTKIVTALAACKDHLKKFCHDLPRGAVIHTVEAVWHFANGDHWHGAVALGIAALSVLHGRH